MKHQPLYHIDEVVGGKLFQITSKPLTLVQIKHMGGGSILKLEKSGFRIRKSGAMLITKKRAFV